MHGQAAGLLQKPSLQKQHKKMEHMPTPSSRRNFLRSAAVLPFLSAIDPVFAAEASKYATTNVNEFVAEVKGARSVGKRLDYQVMRAYRAAAGLPAKPKPKFRPTKPKQPKKK